MICFFNFVHEWKQNIGIFTTFYSTRAHTHICFNHEPLYHKMHVFMLAYTRTYTHTAITVQESIQSIPASSQQQNLRRKKSQTRMNSLCVSVWSLLFVFAVAVPFAHAHNCLPVCRRHHRRHRRVQFTFIHFTCFNSTLCESFVYADCFGCCGCCCGCRSFFSHFVFVFSRAIGPMLQRPSMV